MRERSDACMDAGGRAKQEPEPTESRRPPVTGEVQPASTVHKVAATSSGELGHEPKSDPPVNAHLACRERPIPENYHISVPQNRYDRVR